MKLTIFMAAAAGAGQGIDLPDAFDQGRPAAAGLAFDFGPDTMKRLMDEVQQELDSLPL